MRVAPLSQEQVKEVEEIARDVFQQENEKQGRNSGTGKQEQPDSGPGFFVSALLMSIPLLGLGFLFLWINRRLDDLDRVYASLRNRTPNATELTATLDNFQQVLDANAQEIDQLRASSPLRLKAEIKAELLNELRASLQAAKPRSSAVTSHEQSYAMHEPGYAMENDDTPPAPPKLWPAKVSVCLKRIGSDGISAKRTYMRGDLLQEAMLASEDSLYVLARDPQRRGLFLVIPSLDRFNSSQDFNHYSTFYDCDRPAAGEVWVSEPALATYDKSSGHWRLHQKGQLQIG